MPSGLHIDPDRLHAHGRRLAGLLAELLPLPVVDGAARAALAATPDGAVLLVELDRAAAAVDRIGRELADLTAGLHVTAYAAGAADAEARAALAEPS